jgi:hypothetical protein
MSFGKVQAWSLRYARTTVQIAKETESVGERTLAEAERSRLAAERDRRFVHLLQIATVVEDIFWEGVDRLPTSQMVVSLRSQMGQPEEPARGARGLV